MEHKIGLSTPPSFAFCFAEASERFRQIKSQQQVGAGGAWPHLQLAVPCAAAPRARGLEVNSKGKGLDNPGCGVWKGLDLIPSSCRGEVLPLTMGISLKASAGAPGTGSPMGSHLSLQGQPGGGRNACGIPALPKTAPAGTQRNAGEHRVPALPLEPDPHSLQGNLPLGRRGQKAWMSGTPGKGWELSWAV